MWFALRDLAFGKTDFPTPVVPDNIARPDANVPVFPDLADPVRAASSTSCCNLLMIEFRAERGFSSTERLLRDPELFTTRRAEAEHAAEIVNRIRTDEAVHVHSLRLYLGELRTLDFKTKDGKTRSGPRHRRHALGRHREVGDHRAAAARGRAAEAGAAAADRRASPRPSACAREFLALEDR